ncbi:MAG: hypothetical protein Q8O75_03835 [bacterium]|nr:hypothetical protein [bacterium]
MYVTIGFAMGVVFALAVVVLVLAQLTRSIRDSTLDFIRHVYEPALYAAMKEYYDDEAYGSAYYKPWRRILYFLTDLRLYWIPSIRKKLEAVHSDKEAQFGGSVKVSVNWRSRDVGMQLQPWTFVYLDHEGREVGERDTMSRRMAMNPDYVTPYRAGAVTLLVLNPNGQVAAKREAYTKEVEPRSRISGGN